MWYKHLLRVSPSDFSIVPGSRKGASSSAWLAEGMCKWVCKLLGCSAGCSGERNLPMDFKIVVAPLSPAVYVPFMESELLKPETLQRRR